MSKPSFVYVTYIKSTPQKVWDALLDGEMTKLYWGRQRNVSDWKPGSKWEHQHYDDPSGVDIIGQVLDSDPPRKLVLTWSEPKHAEDPAKTSRVIFEIEPFADAVRLTVRHEELEPGSDMLEGITRGWPAIVSSLKSLLETGEPLAMTTRRWA